MAIFFQTNQAKYTDTWSCHSETTAWFQPKTVAKLLDLRVQHPNSRLVFGNTGFKPLKYQTLISGSHVTELDSISMDATRLTVGAGVKFSKLEQFLSDQIQAKG